MIWNQAAYHSDLFSIHANIWRLLHDTLLCRVTCIPESTEIHHTLGLWWYDPNANTPINRFMTTFHGLPWTWFGGVGCQVCNTTYILYYQGQNSRISTVVAERLAPLWLIDAYNIHVDGDNFVYITKGTLNQGGKGIITHDSFKALSWMKISGCP